MMSSEALITNDEEVRIVMVGKTGAGKSATGNTILGYEAFKSSFAAVSQTEQCQKARAVIGLEGRKVSVVDTPGLFDTNSSEEKIIKEIKQCICFAAPGPHVILLVIRLGRFTKEEQRSVEMIQTVFGEMSSKYTIVLFTGGDQLRGEPVEDFLKNCKKLQELNGTCVGGYHVFDNGTKDPSQVTELMAKIESMAEKNGRSHYTTEVFQEAEGAIQEEKTRILAFNKPEILIAKEKLKVDFAPGLALAQAETRLVTEYVQRARDDAEKSNSFLSNVKEAIVEAARKLGEACRNAMDRCSIQ